MIRLVHLLAAILALGSQGRSALDAAFADWRHEQLLANTIRRRIAVDVISASGVFRIIAKVGLAELPSALVSPFVWRLAAIGVLWVVWVLKDGVPIDAARFFLVTSPPKAWALLAASFAPQFLVVTPLMVFFAEAVGPRRWVTPVGGTLVWLTASMSLLGFVLLPVAMLFVRVETWRYFANASVPRPQAAAVLVASIGILPTIFMAVLVCLLFVFANRLRRVGGVTGWGLSLGVVIAAYVVGMMLLNAPGPVDLRIALMLAWPPLMLTAILWATLRLARIEANRAAALPAGGLSHRHN